MWREQGFVEKKLTATGARDAGIVLVEAWEKEIKEKYHRSWGLKTFNREGLQMKFDYRVFGEKPADGRSLYISMHGGGNAPEALNTQQWAESDSFVRAGGRSLCSPEGALG